MVKDKIPLSPPKAINSKEAYDMVMADPAGTFMIDVRTRPEYEFVGHPDLENGVPNIPLFFYDDWRPNVDFVIDVEARYPKEATLLIICRSGHRAETAAWQLLKAGYLNVYFVADSFEGALDSSGHRTIDGWKNDGLPYTYYLDSQLIYKS
ncbi:MAG: rhodanese-like domain-containing protein [Thermodesulfobacteriota bacterium]